MQYQNTEIEKKVFCELYLGADTREVVAYVGAQLLKKNFDFKKKLK
jgi:hypothetical protein